MAITSKNYKRPQSANDLYSSEKIFKSPLSSVLSSITTTVPMTPLPTGQSYISADIYREEIICGGTVKVIGQKIGFLMYDTKAGDVGEFCIIGGLVLVQIAPGEVFGLGDFVLIASVNGLAYAIGGGDFTIGFVEGDSEGNPTITDPDGLPSGEYVYCRLYQVSVGGGADPL